VELTGWGRYPRVEAELRRPLTAEDAASTLRFPPDQGLIPRGLGRSYGDSALAPSVVGMEYLDHFIDFDPASGALTCAAGVTLAEILEVFVPRGWFPTVTPGTKFVTVGGAIASDVHGKNHHLEGSFSDHVRELTVATVAEGVVHCSPTLRPELFHATCGGMGLTGIILQATLSLKPIASATIRQTTIKADNLHHALALLETHSQATYSVAWIDCLAQGRNLGRSLVMLGEHVEGGEHAEKDSLSTGKGASLAVPVEMPGFLLNRHAIQVFNALYYARIRQPVSERIIHYEPFFYPLDGIQHWNRLYGRGGFVQYQFVLPRAAGNAGMTAILERIASSRRGSFLAVLKGFGEGNDNYLSFPTAGYTLALDFKMDPGLLPLLTELDAMVLDFGGRLYLAKDARMSREMFDKSYPGRDAFMAVRQHYGADKVLHSRQSRRLGL
jgi:FAD/FMN-containing dehydrogenase